MNFTICPMKITNHNFKNYGNLISIKNKKFKNINNGYAKNFYDLAKIDIKKAKGAPKLSIFKAKARKFPFKIELMERHPISSQLFFPLDKHKFLVVVSNSKYNPHPDTLRSFIVPENCGINYKAGVCHYPLIVIKNSLFLVFDRKGSKKNLEIFKYKKEKIELSYE